MNKKPNIMTLHRYILSSALGDKGSFPTPPATLQLDCRADNPAISGLSA